MNAVSAPPGQQVKNGTIALGTLYAAHPRVAFGPSNVVKALVDAGADVNAKEARGMTPLMYGGHDRPRRHRDREDAHRAGCGSSREKLPKAKPPWTGRRSPGRRRASRC